MIPCNKIRDGTTTTILEKTESQRHLYVPKAIVPIVPNIYQHMYPNCIIVISNDVYFVYKFVSNFVHQKPRSVYPKNFLKCETTVPLVERFSPKVDRHQFTFG